MSNDNVTEVNLDARNEIVKSLEIIKRNLPVFIEYQQLIAKIRWAYYLELIAQGFTEEQALEICCKASLFGN